jgi:hypothetical protein
LILQTGPVAENLRDVLHRVIQIIVSSQSGARRGQRESSSQ